MKCLERNLGNQQNQVPSLLKNCNTTINWQEEKNRVEEACLTLKNFSVMAEDELS